MSIKSFFSLYFARTIVKKNLRWKNNAVNAQNKLMISLIKTAKNTQFGIDHKFSAINNYSDFKKNIPIRDYEGLLEYIEKIKNGEENILWPKKTNIFL